MPFYNSQGSIPSKRHTVFKKNRKLLYEQHISRDGFSGIYSNMYHLSMPTQLKKVGNFNKIIIAKSEIKHFPRHFKTYYIKKSSDAISSRVPLLFNDDIIISVALINKNMNYLYRSGHFDELLYIQYGSGILMTNFGNLTYKKGDYVIIPKGIIWKIKYTKKTKMLVVES